MFVWYDSRESGVHTMITLSTLTVYQYVAIGLVLAILLLAYLTKESL